MKRALLVSPFLPVLVAGGCAPRYDVFVAWTIDGAPAVEACEQFEEPSVIVRTLNRDTEDGEVSDSSVTEDCSNSQVLARAGAFSEITVTLYEASERFAESAPISIAPGTGSYPGAAIEDPIRADLVLEHSRLQARLTVVGKSCGDAGVSSFDVSLRQHTSPLGTEVIHEETVACENGEAIFKHAPLEVGSTYEVIARADAGGVNYATSDESVGEGVLVERALTELTVDLDIVERP